MDLFFIILTIVGTFFVAGFLFFLLKENERLRDTLQQISWHPCVHTGQYEVGAKEMIAIASDALEEYE